MSNSTVWNISRAVTAFVILIAILIRVFVGGYDFQYGGLFWLWISWMLGCRVVVLLLGGTSYLGYGERDEVKFVKGDYVSYFQSFLLIAAYIPASIWLFMLGVGMVS